MPFNLHRSRRQYFKNVIMISRVCEVKGRDTFAAPKISCLENVCHKHDSYGIFFLLFGLVVFFFFFFFSLSQASFLLLHLDPLKNY